MIELPIRWASVATLLVLLPLRIILTRCGVVYPPVLNTVLAVLVSAAVGYVTNWIAIEMLFKPYERNPRHPFSILTFGYWQQGLVPRNKNEIGVQLGRETEQKLLKPEVIARELCDVIPEILRDKGLTSRIVDGVKGLVMRYREPISAKVVGAVQSHAPQILEICKQELRQMIVSYVNSNKMLSAAIVFLGGAEGVAATAIKFVNWQSVQERLTAKFSDPATAALVGTELEHLLNVCMAWVENDLADTLIPQLQTLANGPVKDKIVAKLNLSGRIAQAVENQDVREFHAMINTLAAKHLGAIQILGYFLGAAVGLLQIVR